MRRLVGGVALVSLVASVVGVRIATAAQGDLDLSFGGGDGYVGASISIEDTLRSLAFQSDGKIVVAGDSLPPLQSVLLRYNSDGTPDNTFGGQGPDGNAAFDTVYERVYDMAIDSSDRIVVLAAIGASKYLRRYTSTGSVDTGFAGGSPPLILTSPSSFPEMQVATTSDGGIVVGGSDGNGDFFVRRFTDAGLADTSFGGGDGIITTNVPGSAFRGRVEVQTDGKIVLAGSVSTTDLDFGHAPLLPSDCEVMVLRYLADGTPDTSFSGDGQASTVTDGCPYLAELALAPDGQVVTSARRDNKFLFFRLLSSGNGTGSAELDRGLHDGYLGALEVQTDGKVVVGGQISESGTYRMRLVRFTENMTLDSSFGGGEIVLGLGPDLAQIYSIAIAPDNKIVVGGRYRPVGNDDILVARFDAISTAATLGDLTVAGGTLAETFAPGTTSYSASVPNSVKSITVTPTATDRNAVITVDNATTTSGTASSPISLKHGANYVNLRVTAQDGLTEKIYTITVTRRDATLKVKKTMTAKTALASVDKPLPRGAKVSITVAKASKKVCSVSAGKIRGLKRGTCRVTVAVTPPRTALVKKPKTTRTAVTITVN